MVADAPARRSSVNRRARSRHSAARRSPSSGTIERTSGSLNRYSPVGEGGGASMVSRPPKDQFTSLDALALARELRSMESPHVDKAFDFPEHGWVLALRSRRERRRDLVLMPGQYGALASESV